MKKKKSATNTRLVLVTSLIAVSLITGCADNTNEQVVASNLAAEYLEGIRGLTYASTYPDAGENVTIPSQYTVTINTECSINGNDFSACTGSANETLQKIVIAVSREGSPGYA